MKVTIDAYGLSDVGNVRENNEDQFIIADLRRALCIERTTLPRDGRSCIFGATAQRVLAVADGMGGHSAGEKASSLAVTTLSAYLLNLMPWFFSLREDDEEDLLEDLQQAMVRCDLKVRSQAPRTPNGRSMGTTLTMGLVIWPRLYVVHAGDSRCYLYRPTEGIEQITTDHTYAQEMVEKGAMTPEDAKRSRWRHVLSQAIGGGGERRVDADVYKVVLQPGDTVLLCTDGLSGPVGDERIASVLSGELSAERCCNALLKLAKDSGGPDNITVVVARFPVSQESS